MTRHPLVGCTVYDRRSGALCGVVTGAAANDSGTDLPVYYVVGPDRTRRCFYGDEIDTVPDTPPTDPADPCRHPPIAAAVYDRRHGTLLGTVTRTLDNYSETDLPLLEVIGPDDTPRRYYGDEIYAVETSP